MTQSLLIALAACSNTKVLKQFEGNHQILTDFSPYPQSHSSFQWHDDSLALQDQLKDQVSKFLRLLPGKEKVERLREWPEPTGLSIESRVVRR